METEEVVILKGELAKFICRTLAEQDISSLEGKSNLIYYVSLSSEEDIGDVDKWEGLELPNLKHFIEIIDDRLKETD